MLNEAGSAFLTLMDPTRLFFLFGGVMVGLSLGVIPGLGGIVGMALLLPFTFSMDPYSAMALLLGMGSVTTTSDTIPAVLFGVPGTTGSAATVLDGHPLAKQGQAGRAFGAAYSASLIGGLFGALLLAVSIPVLRPIMLYIGSPELLAISFFGLSMVAVLSGRAPLRGLAGGCLGLMIAMIGSDPQSGTLRWTMGTLYLFDGLSLVPITLGLFAIPELADMAISRKSIAGDHVIDSRSGQWQGVKDTFTHWWLTLRCAWLGASLGAVPGRGAGAGQRRKAPRPDRSGMSNTPAQNSRSSSARPASPSPKATLASYLARNSSWVRGSFAPPRRWGCSNSATPPSLKVTLRWPL